MSTAVMSNDQLLERLNSAFKAVTDVSTLGASVLATQKFDRFVREARDATIILPTARLIVMDSPKVEIDRVGFSGRVLRSGNDGAGANRTLVESEFANPTFALQTLDAEELQAVASLRDAALRRNIERGDFENTLVDLFGQAAGRDLEEYALLSDLRFAHATDDVLSKTDGWLRRAGNKLFAGGTATDFDEADSESIFEALLKATPKRFIDDPTQWRFYTPWAVRNSYQDTLRARGTDLGDRLQTGVAAEMSLTYKGIPVVYSPGLEKARAPTTVTDPVTSAGVGRAVLFTHPDNLVWGVFHEVTVEREREAKARRTDFVLTVEADANYEDPSAAAVGYLDLQSGG